MLNVHETAFLNPDNDKPYDMGTPSWSFGISCQPWNWSDQCVADRWFSRPGETDRSCCLSFFGCGMYYASLQLASHYLSCNFLWPPRVFFTLLSHCLFSFFLDTLKINLRYLKLRWLGASRYSSEASDSRDWTAITLALCMPTHLHHRWRGGWV